MSASDAAFVSLFAPTSIGDARRAALRVRERQFKAAFNPAKTAAIARAIVAKKIVAESHARTIKREFLARLQKARTTDDVRHWEAKAAQVWWQQNAVCRASRERECEGYGAR